MQVKLYRLTESQIGICPCWIKTIMGLVEGRCETNRAIFPLFRKKNQSVLEVPGVWSHVLKWISGKERPAPLGLLWESGIKASTKCVCVCVVQVRRKGKREQAEQSGQEKGGLEQLCKIVWPAEDAGKRCIPLWLPVHPVLHTLASLTASLYNCDFITQTDRCVNRFCFNRSCQTTSVFFT